MLRIPSRQALRALRNPFFNSFPNPLRGLVPARHLNLHDPPAPFSGPPSYKTLARRFSPSSPSPITFFVNKKSEEAIKRGEYIDIHDQTLHPKDFDVLITDVSNKTLRTDIAELAGIEYLANASKDEAEKKVDIGRGFYYGDNNRLIFPCIVCGQYMNEPRWVFFIVDSGAPETYLSAETMEALGINASRAPVTIAGYTNDAKVSPKGSHFADINLLGSDYFRRYRVALGPNEGDIVDVLFGWGAKWEMPKAKL